MMYGLLGFSFWRVLLSNFGNNLHKFVLQIWSVRKKMEGDFRVFSWVLYGWLAFKYWSLFAINMDLVLYDFVVLVHKIKKVTLLDFIYQLWKFSECAIFNLTNIVYWLNINELLELVPLCVYGFGFWNYGKEMLH